jgi:hypothetical protein
MTVGDVYTATLVIISQDLADPSIEIPVTMTVIAPVIYMPLIWKVP